MPATVAPLGTALTEDQLALLWKMADEPVLCFDGDSAGLRAAYRAVDLAHAAAEARQEPEIRAAAAGPGPRRSGPLGRARSHDRSDRRRATACRQLLWARETEGHQFDTPERRAALEARINEVTSAIGDDSVRKYYRQDFNARLSAFFAPAQGPRGNRERNWRGGGGEQGQNWRERRAREWPPRNGAIARPAANGRPAPYVVASQQMAGSPVHRGHRTAVPRREALILQAALNHPWLLHDHLEELSQLEFRHADAERLKGALIDIAAHAAALDAAGLRAELATRGLIEVSGAHRRRHHHRLGLGRPGRGRPRRCVGHLGPACRLASPVAFTN